MTKYKVIWEVSKYAIIEAESEADAIEKLLNDDDGEVIQYENEMTDGPRAFRVD